MKKKIAVIGLKGLPAFGGVASVGENIIHQLKNRYEFTVYAISSHADKKGEFNGFTQIVLRKFPIKKLNILYYYVASALHAIIKGRYDLVHIHHIDGAFILFLLRLKYKIISTSHGRTQLVNKWSNLEKLYFSINEKIFLKLSQVITVVSMNLAEVYRGKTEKEIIYIPNGTQLELQSGTFRDVDENDYLLFAAGRIIPDKGCHVLLEAMKIMNYQGRLLVIGDLNQVPAYKKRITELASSLNVGFIDLIKERSLLLSYVDKAKLFVFPSSTEAMSMMLLEVASMKTPLICSDIPENLAVFNDKEVLFFKTDDPENLAEKIDWSLGHPEFMEELARKAYDRVKKEYQWSKIADEYDRLYKNMLVP